MSAPAQTIKSLGEGWLEVLQEGTPAPFYVHQPTNTTQWHRPVLDDGSAGVEHLTKELCAHFGLVGPSINAAAQRCHDLGVCTLADFQQRVHENHLHQLGFSSEDKQRIVAARKRESDQRCRLQADAARDTAAVFTVEVGTTQPIKLSLKGIDICAAWTDAVVSPANSHSFTQGDGGVSGVLRDACSNVGRTGNFSDVCYQPKTWISDDGQELTGTTIPETQAGLQHAGGRLRSCGVKYVIHAVGPAWTQFTAEQCADPNGEHFRYIETMIRTTTMRSLTVAASRGCKTIIVPSISGGIFTHGGNEVGAGALPDQREKEQFAARVAVVAACRMWAEDASGRNSSVREIILVDHPSPNIGRLDLLTQSFSLCFASEWQPPTAQPPPGTVQLPPPPTYAESEAPAHAEQHSSASNSASKIPESEPPETKPANCTPPDAQKQSQRSRNKTITLAPCKLAGISSEHEHKTEPEPELEPEPHSDTSTEDSHANGQPLANVSSISDLTARVWTKRSTNVWSQAIAKIEQPSGTLQPGLYIYKHDSDISSSDVSDAMAAADYEQEESIANLHGCSIEKLVEGWITEEELAMMQICNGPGAARDFKVAFPNEPGGGGESACDKFISACTNLSAGRKWNQGDGFAPPFVTQPIGPSVAGITAAGSQQTPMRTPGIETVMRHRHAAIVEAAKVAKTGGKWVKAKDTPAIAAKKAEIKAAAELAASNPE